MRKYSGTGLTQDYYHTDHLGSPISLTSSTGTTVATYTYDTYGTPTLTSGNTHDNSRLYTGREFDSETGLYYNRARYYNPSLGRFISRDPIDIQDDVNLYSYVKNNPIDIPTNKNPLKRGFFYLRFSEETV